LQTKETGVESFLRVEMKSETPATAIPVSCQQYLLT
jgi:hypothetical protein